MNIYIYNLSSAIGDAALKQLFTAYGEVKSAAVVNDVFSGESRGFGYVEMEDNTSALNAIKGLNNTEQGELKISVEEAEPEKAQQVSDRIGDPLPRVYRFAKN